MGRRSSKTECASHEQSKSLLTQYLFSEKKKTLDEHFL